MGVLGRVDFDGHFARRAPFYVTDEPSLGSLGTVTGHPTHPHRSPNLPPQVHRSPISPTPTPPNSPPPPNSPAARRPPSRTRVGDGEITSDSESLPPEASSSSESVSQAFFPGFFFFLPKARLGLFHAVLGRWRTGRKLEESRGGEGRGGEGRGGEGRGGEGGRGG